MIARVWHSRLDTVFGWLRRAAAGQGVVGSRARSVIAIQRSGQLTETSGRQLLYALRRTWADGSTVLLLTPRELLERLAALVPPPRRRTGSWKFKHPLEPPRHPSARGSPRAGAATAGPGPPISGPRSPSLG